MTFIYFLYRIRATKAKEMKVTDLKKGDIVSLEYVINDDEPVVAMFLGWTVGSSATEKDMLFVNITSMGWGNKETAIISFSPESAMGKIKLLLTLEEYKKLIENLNEITIKTFDSPDKISIENARTISLPAKRD